MALPINIKDLIYRRVVENARVEYKRDWNPENIIHAICAFANDIDNWGGGYIVIGVGEENSIKSDRFEKAYYIRKMSNSIRANQLEEKELFLLANNVPFDDRANMRANIEDLKPSLISNFLYEINSDLYSSSLSMSLKELADNMHLSGGPSELVKPLNVGLMFFNERPDVFFPYTRIEVVDKPDPTGEGMTEKVFVGSLDRQLKDALSYIQNYIIKEKIKKDATKAEANRLYNFPFAAVEEALSNAVYHKSYQIGEPITVTITPDKMEITSLPGPDRTITDEDIKNCHLVSKRYRNRRIGDFLKELKLVEGRNTGIPTIVKALSLNGSDMPIFETDDDRTYFTVIIPVQKEFIPVAKKFSAPKNSRKSRAEIKELILYMLRENGNISKSELALAMGYTKVTDAVSSAIKELMTEEKVKYLYPDNKHDMKQKICLL